MSVKRNISLFYVISSLMWGRFFVPVLALFYVASQVSLSQFSLIMGVFSLSILLLEIPSGVISDLLGRKKTLLLSRFLYIVEVAMIAFGNGFWIFFIAKIISGIGVSLSSGTDSALVYETMKKLKREKEHKLISGKISTISTVSMAFVFIIGSFLFQINPKLPAYASLPLLVIGFFLTFLLKEPYPNTVTVTFKKSIQHLKESISLFLKNKFVIYLTLYSIFLGGVISVSLSLSSAYFEAILIPIILIGVIQFIGSLLMAYGSRHTAAFEKKYGEKVSFRSLRYFILISTVTMSLLFPFVGVLFYLLIPLSSGLLGILVNNVMNEHVSSKYRATMLSVKNMFSQLVVFILFPVVGFLQVINFSYGYILLSLVLVMSFVITSYYAKRNQVGFS